MSESLEDFLSPTKKLNLTKASGSFTCQVCDEVINVADLDEEDMILIYVCSQRHESRVRL